MIPYLLQIITIIMSIDVNWSDYTDPIRDMFTGNSTKGIEGIFEGDMQLFALFLFFIIFLLTMLWGIGMLIGITIIVPTTFLITDSLPELRIIVAIIAGLGFGLALHKLIRR